MVTLIVVSVPKLHTEVIVIVEDFLEGKNCLFSNVWWFKVLDLIRKMQIQVLAHPSLPHRVVVVRIYGGEGNMIIILSNLGKRWYINVKNKKNLQLTIPAKFFRHKNSHMRCEGLYWGHSEDKDIRKTLLDLAKVPCSSASCFPQWPTSYPHN